LGLSISKAYVEMLGGKIWMENNAEKNVNASGATFFFTIPVYPPAKVSSFKPGTLKNSRRADFYKLKKKIKYFSMNKQKTTSNEYDNLRRAAELLLNKKEKGTEASFVQFITLKLIRELELYQIELEMQNDELILAKKKAELIEKKFTELYDFAPSGYLTLTKKGEMEDLNIGAEHLFGKELKKNGKNIS